MRRALSEYVVTGIRTNLGFHEQLFAHPDFAAGRYDTGFVERHEEALRAPLVPEAGRRDALALALAVAAAQMDGAASRVSSARAGHDPRQASLSPWVAHHRANRARS